MKTTIAYACRDNYLIFRASIESLFAYVPRDHYNKILIVDDCSTDKRTIEFLKYLDTLDFVKVILAGDPTSISYYNPRGNGAPDPDKKKLSIGHGESQNIAIRNTETENIYFVDSDTLWMSKSKNLLPQLERCLELEENILSTGQLVGDIDTIKIVDKQYVLSNHPDTLTKQRGGWPVHICVMNKMTTWNKHKLPKMVNGGWTNEQHMPEFWRRGFKTCNFNVFRDGFMLHLGYATLRQTRNMQQRGFVYAKNGWSIARNRGWWYGYNTIPFTTDEFMCLLEKKYGNLPFETRSNIISWEQ